MKYLILHNLHSKHNSAYWEYRPYLGIGPSAHSYDGENQRSWNIPNNAKYIKSLYDEILPQEVEILSQEEAYNEMLMIGLRTSKGVNLKQMKMQFSGEMMHKLAKCIEPKIHEGTLDIDQNHLKFNKKHWFLADGIASDLFLV